MVLNLVEISCVIITVGHKNIPHLQIQYLVSDLFSTYLFRHYPEDTAMKN